MNTDGEVKANLLRKLEKAKNTFRIDIKLLDLPIEVKGALTQKQISLATAEELVWLKNDGSKKKIATECLNQKMPMHEVRHIVKAVNSSKQGDIFDSEMPFSLDSSESIREKEFSKTISESILILRIALVRMDDLATRTKDPYLKQTIVSKRIALHSLIDELITDKETRIPDATTRRSIKVIRHQSIVFRYS